MCSWNWEKLKIVDKGFIKETGFFNIYIKEKCKCVFFIFISVILWLAFFGVCIFIHYFFDVVRTGVNQKKIKSSKKMSCKRAFHFDQWKTFSKNYRSVRVWLWLVYKFTENCCRLRLFSEFILRVHPTSWQNKYPNLKTTCHMKLIFFLWTKLLENLHFARYLISVTATLNYKYLFVV